MTGVQTCALPICHPVLWGIIKPFLRKNNAKLTPSFRQVLFPKKLPVLTGLTSPTFKDGFGLYFLRFKKQKFRTFTESFKIIPYSLLLKNRCLFFEYSSSISSLIIPSVTVNFKMNLAPGWVLFSYTLFRKEPHIILQISLIRLIS